MKIDTCVKPTSRHYLVSQGEAKNWKCKLFRKKGQNDCFILNCIQSGPFISFSLARSSNEVCYLKIIVFPIVIETYLVSEFSAKDLVSQI